MRETVWQLQKLENKNRKMVGKLTQIGIKIKFEEVSKQSSAQNLGRVHLALALLIKEKLIQLMKLLKNI